MKYAPPIGQESQGEDAHYVDGNPELGILGSPVPAAAIEQGQRELLHVIKQAGLTPSGDDLTQLWQAIRQIIIVAKPGLATTKTPGLVQIGDGLTITAQGLLSVLVASVSQAGIMRPDGITCTVVGGVLSVQQQTSEEWRTSWIGVPRPWRSTALPSSHCWANGDFVAFADWPELEQVYAAGGFEGMLMAWDADGETQAANLGQWRPDAAEPTGLYVPQLSKQFLRCFVGADGDQTAGTAHNDTMRPITGQVTSYSSQTPTSSGALSWEPTGTAVYAGKDASVGNIRLNSANIGATYSGTETAPVHVYQPYIIYLGKPAKETA